MGEASHMKLTEPQWRVLNRICRTNGGGVDAWGRDAPVIRRLHEKGLVQGKAGQQHCAVHTREGLELWRSLIGAAHD